MNAVSYDMIHIYRVIYFPMPMAVAKNFTSIAQKQAYTEYHKFKFNYIVSFLQCELICVRLSKKKLSTHTYGLSKPF